MSSPNETLSFEQAVAEIERILRELEDGGGSLEDCLGQYERGVTLLRTCYAQLRDAEQRIMKVAGLDADGKPTLTPFDATLPGESELGDDKRSGPSPRTQSGAY